MGLFGAKKKEVLDLSRMYKKQSEKPSVSPRIANKSQVSSQTKTPSAFSFFGNLGSSSQASSASQTLSASSEENSSEGYSPENYGEDSEEDKKRKLAKRLVDMTKKTEDLSNQIYHLQQRMEVLEKKFDAGKY